MIAWILWFFAAPHVVLLDGWLYGLAAPLRVDVGTALCLLFAVHARTRALPGLLFCTALGRALFLNGDLPLHFCALALPVAALLPLRVVFFRRSPLWHCAAAAFLALTVPRAAVFFARVSGQSTDVLADPGTGGVLLAMVTAPLLALGLRAVPPLSLFVERGE